MDEENLVREATIRVVIAFFNLMHKEVEIKSGRDGVECLSLIYQSHNLILISISLLLMKTWISSTEAIFVKY